MATNPEVSQIRTSVDDQLPVRTSNPPLRDSQRGSDNSDNPKPVYKVRWFRGEEPLPPEEQASVTQQSGADKPWFRDQPGRSPGPLVIEPGPDDKEEQHGKYLCVITFWVAVVLVAVALAIIYTVVKVADDDCDHGTALPGSVTVPDDTDALQGFALVWSFLPYVVALAATAFMFYQQTMWPCQVLLMVGLIVVLNEAVVKQIVSQSRPDGSCLHSNGMPSSHSELATGSWVYAILEITMKEQLLIEPRSAWWSDPAARTKRKAMYLALITLVCVPIPFSRVSLEDHSWAQIGVGALIGTAIAIGWYFLMNKWAYNHLDRIADLLQGCPGGLLDRFTNDYFPTPDEAHATANQAACRKNLTGSETPGQDGLSAQDATQNHSVV